VSAEPPLPPVTPRVGGANGAAPDGAAAAEAAATVVAARDAARPGYAGLATRVIAFAADAAIIDGVAILVSVAVGLGLSLFDLPDSVGTLFAAVGAVAFLVWMAAYFVVFWSTTGQTPGNRLMQIRVQNGRGGTVRVRHAVLRLLFLPVAIIPLGAGLVPIVIDARRRALQDMVAGTVVTYVPPVVRPARHG